MTFKNVLTLTFSDKKYMFNFSRPKQPASPKTVDEIVSQFAQTIDDLHKAAEVASGDVVNAEEAIKTWEQHKAYAQTELDRAKAIAAKFESLLS